MWLVRYIIILDFNKNCILLLADNYVCTDGYKGYNGHCYLAFTSGYTYVVAKRICTEQGGQLAEINSQGEQYYVEGMQV